MRERRPPRLPGAIKMSRPLAAGSAKRRHLRRGRREGVPGGLTSCYGACSRPDGASTPGAPGIDAEGRDRGPGSVHESPVRPWPQAQEPSSPMTIGAQRSGSSSETARPGPICAGPAAPRSRVRDSALLQQAPDLLLQPLIAARNNELQQCLPNRGHDHSMKRETIKDRPAFGFVAGAGQI